MYRFQLLNMTHGSAGLSPKAIANIYQLSEGVLPIDLKAPVAEMEPRADLVVYCFEAGEMPGSLGPCFIFAYEKPNGVARVLDNGSRSRGLYTLPGIACCRKFRCFSTRGLNWIEFTCHFPEPTLDPVSADAPAAVQQ